MKLQDIILNINAVFAGEYIPCRAFLTSMVTDECNRYGNNIQL